MSTKNEDVSTGNDGGAMVRRKPRMTTVEIEVALTRIAVVEKGVRFLLLELFERDAHLTMGCETFPEFCTKYIGTKYGPSYTSQLLHAARIERTLNDELSLDFSKLGEIKRPKLSVAATYEISKLPQDKWKQIYSELCERDEHGNRNEASLLLELKRMVTRTKNEMETGSSVVAKKSATPAAIETAPLVKPKNNMTPIVPQTYESGPENDNLPEPEWLRDPSVILAPKVADEPEVREEMTAEEIEAERMAIESEQAQIDFDAQEAARLEEEHAPDLDAPQRYPATDAVITLGIEETVSRTQYDALFCIAKAFDVAFMAADKDAGIEAHSDYKKFLKEWPQ